MEETYYIQDSRSFHGNAVIWWGQDGHGYTSDINAAGKYGRSEAERICQRNTDIAWLCDYIDANTKSHKTIIDAQYLSRKESGIK